MSSAPESPDAAGPVAAGPVAEIDLGAVCANYRMLQAAAPGAEAAGVVKCNAYGVGMAEAAKVLSQREGCKTFFVAYAQEGAALRSVIGNDARIYVFNGPLPGTLSFFRDAALTPILNSLTQARDWANAFADAPAALHIDTGMNRLGAPLSEVGDIAGLALNIELAMSHLACGSSPDHPKNAEQRDRFDAVSKQFPNAKRSLAASAGALMDASYHFDLIRPGVALYGGSPFDIDEPRLAPVVSLKAPIIQIRDLQPGETVGYGATFTAEKPVRIATAAIGYGDGVPVSGSNRMEATIKGERANIAGRVSMDMIGLDVTPFAETVCVGDVVELFGKEISLFEAAQSCATHTYELLTRLGGRIDRRYL